MALSGDIEKAFLMVSINEKDRDSLRFLWVSDPADKDSELMTLRFTRVMFGVSSSPFLLNATVNHHIRGFHGSDPEFAEKFLSSIYVDDLVSGDSDVNSAFNFYLKSKLRLSTAGFNLRKFITNSTELRDLIHKNELAITAGNQEEKSKKDDEGEHSTEEDETYAKSSLGVKIEEKQGIHKILGVQWDVAEDEFRFDVTEVATTLQESSPTKRSVVKVTAKFFDPLGVMTPVTVLFKLFCKELCEEKVGWDDPLSGRLLEKWNHLSSQLEDPNVITIPRCLLTTLSQPIRSAKLIGFCDASTKAYACVVYLRLESEISTKIQFIAAKSRVAPSTGTTIPRMELLSAVLLSKLISSIRSALESELTLSDSICFTDSKVTLFWIQGITHEWKQFVQNRVVGIRALVSPDCWRHCPGKENPADIPSRGMSASLLANTPLWLNGPEFIHSQNEASEDSTTDISSMPDDCQKEIKPRQSVLIAIEDSQPDISTIIDPKRYNSAHRLFRMTSIVLKFIHILRDRVAKASSLTDTPDANYFEQARICWILHYQAELRKNEKYALWKQQLDLFEDDFGILRCGGRLSNSSLTASAHTPIILHRSHLATLLIQDAHKRVMHNGVSETLAELRSAYWLPRGRQLIRKLIHHCVVCKRLEGKHCLKNPSPPLPSYRVNRSRPFEATGVDFAGPLYVTSTSGSTKTWLCLFTCCTTRAVHLEIVPDMMTGSFINCFKRFISRHGVPARMISDNGKTFKSAKVIIQRKISSLVWQFNLERAPWWGGIFERMVKSAKRCMRKAIGRNSLTYDELVTLTTEVEAVLNSRPLTYINSEDVNLEPLTPLHLLVGFRILTTDCTPSEQDHEVSMTRRMIHLQRVLNKFWKRWKHEYLCELREHHRTVQGKGRRNNLQKGEVVTIYDEGHPRGLWRLGRIIDFLPSTDQKLRGVTVKVVSKKGQSRILRRPIEHIYPLEVRECEQASETGEDEPSDVCDEEMNQEKSTDVPDMEGVPTSRPRRVSAQRAKEKNKVLAENDYI